MLLALWGSLHKAIELNTPLILSIDEIVRRNKQAQYALDDIKLERKLAFERIDNEAASKLETMAKEVTAIFPPLSRQIAAITPTSRESIAIIAPIDDRVKAAEIELFLAKQLLIDYK